MIEKNIRVKITFKGNSIEGLDSKNIFWKLIHKEYEEIKRIPPASPDKLEFVFQNKFPNALKQSLSKKFIRELETFQIAYNTYPISQDIIDSISDDIGINAKNYSDILNSLSKLQELKNEYFKENSEYQQLLNKCLIASQIDFGIQNISYSTLGFDLIIEPFEKLIQLFDNNFELFRIFLDVYIPESFLEALDFYYYPPVPISASIEFPNSFKDSFNNRTSISSYSPKYMATDKNQNLKGWFKANYMRLLVNGALLIPTILVLIILHIVFRDIHKMHEFHQKNYEIIQTENDKVIQNYKQLIELQKSTYDGMISKYKKDTIH